VKSCEVKSTAEMRLDTLTLSTDITTVILKHHMNTPGVKTTF